MLKRFVKRLVPVIVLVLLVLPMARSNSLAFDLYDYPIAYVSTRFGRSGIYLTDVAGSKRVRLTNWNSDAGDPTWHPDGTQLAYFRFDTSDGVSLHLFDLETGDEEMILGHVFIGYYLHRLRWTREGKCLAWITGSHVTSFEVEVPVSSDADPDGTVCGARGWKPVGWMIDGPGEQYLLNDTCSPDKEYCLRYEWSPEREGFETFLVSSGTGATFTLSSDEFSWVAWSPDSERMALVIEESFYLVDIADMRVRPYATELAVYGEPTWSPDLRWVVFSARGANGNASIYVLDAVTGELRRLTTHLTDDVGPAWRPAASDVHLQVVDIEHVDIELPIEGQMIVVIRRVVRDSTWYDICLLDTEQSRLIVLKHFETDYDRQYVKFKWSPDGDQIIYGLHDGLGYGFESRLVLRIDGSAEYHFPAPDFIKGSCSWTRDGTYIICGTVVSNITPALVADVYSADTWQHICHLDERRDLDCLPLPLDDYKWLHYDQETPGYTFYVSDTAEPVGSYIETIEPVWFFSDSSTSGDFQAEVKEGNLCITNLDTQVTRQYTVLGAEIVDFKWSPIVGATR